MNYYFLIIIEILILLFNLWIFKRDILNPALFSSMEFLVSTIFAGYSARIWNMQISQMTIGVIAVGLLTMTFACSLPAKIRLHGGNKVIKQGNNQNISTIINVKRKFLTFTVLVSIILTALYAINAYRVGILNGGSGANAFAYMKAGYGIDNSARMNVFIRQGFKVVMAIAYVYIFVFVNNCVIQRQKLKKNVQYLIPVLCGVALTVFAGSRTEILRLFGAFLLDFGILFREKRGWTGSSSSQSGKAIIKKAIPIVIVIAIIAYAVRAVVKTSEVTLSATNSMLYYVSYYIGSPIAVLNTKLRMAFSGGGLLWGKGETVPNQVYLGYLNYGGNVGTILEFTVEYGLVLMMLYIFFIYYVGNVVYRSCLKRTYFAKKRNRNLVIASYFYSLYVLSYYSNALIYFTNVTAILTIILIILFYEILTKQESRVYQLKEA